MPDDHEFYRTGRALRRAIGVGTDAGKDVNLPAEGTALARQQKTQADQRKAVRSFGQLLRGQSSAVIQENTRINKSRGMTEADATAQAIKAKDDEDGIQSDR